MAVAMPSPHTMATWNTPTCAPVKTAALTLPQPKNTIRKVPKNSPVNHFGIVFMRGKVLMASRWQLFNTMGRRGLAGPEMLQVIQCRL